jgi:hypothetical protein
MSRPRVEVHLGLPAASEKQAPALLLFQYHFSQPTVTSFGRASLIHSCERTKRPQRSCLIALDSLFYDIQITVDILSFDAGTFELLASNRQQVFKECGVISRSLARLQQNGQRSHAQRTTLAAEWQGLFC